MSGSDRQRVPVSFHINVYKHMRAGIMHGVDSDAHKHVCIFELFTLDVVNMKNVFWFHL